MKNPLTRRILREFKHDFFKYFVIFVFMIALIGVVSGFLVTDNSYTKIYNDSFVENKIEDGHLSFKSQPDQALIDTIEAKADVTLYEYGYFEETLGDTDKNIRVYSTQREVNLLNMISGELPSGTDEIAIDRMFADNNQISVGDTINLAGKSLRVSGLISSPDYTCLFENNTDMMFDSINFSVAVMSNEGFESFGSKHYTYNYAWLYPEFIERTNDSLAKQKSDDFVDVLEDVIEEYDNEIIDRAVESAKLIMLSEALDEIDSTLGELGESISMYDNDDGYSLILEQINKSIKDEGIDLSEELSDGEREVSLTTSDIKVAMGATQQQIDDAQDYVDTVKDRIVEIEDYVPRYLNQSINYAGDDMSSDKIMFVIFSYIIIIVLAFVFAITISNTISSEAGVIGTLRALGYTRGELVRHYMVLPILVSLVAAIIGNALGYTAFVGFYVDVYNGSFSLPSFELYWNAEAFLMTTVVPLIIMFVINLWTLERKLRLSPLKFLRRDLSRRQKKKAFRLNTRIPFIHRFRTRIIFQNIPNYITMFFGILIGGILVVFGTMFQPLLEDYSEMIINDRICDYQYVLAEAQETSNDSAEKYSIESLSTTDDRYLTDEISVFGIESDSKYVNAEVGDGKVAVANTISEKFGLSVGDTLTLRDSYNEKIRYEFKIGSIYSYNSGLAIFMDKAMFAETFDQKSTDFDGYFSNEKLSDIDDENIATIITISDLTKVSNQMTKSMGEMMGLFAVFGIIIYILLMFIMSRQIIDKNANSIAMTKILGFSNLEIGRLYIIATSVIVVISLLVTIPLIDLSLRWVFSSVLYTEMTGYIPYIVSGNSYLFMFVVGVVCYALISIVQMIKISKIPKSDALKNFE